MDITRFTSNVTGLARGTLFEVTITGCPVQAVSSEILKFTCNSASIPGSTIGVIECPYMGRKIKFPGDRTDPEWTATIMLTHDFQIYKDLFNWHSKINDPSSNISTTDNTNNLKGQALVTMFNQTGKSIFTRKLINFWPSEIQALDVAWENTDQLLSLSVTFNYDYSELVD